MVRYQTINPNLNALGIALLFQVVLAGYSRLNPVKSTTINNHGWFHDSD